MVVSTIKEKSSTTIDGGITFREPIADIISGTFRAGIIFRVSIPRNFSEESSPEGSPKKIPLAPAAAEATVFPALLGPYRHTNTPFFLVVITFLTHVVILSSLGEVTDQVPN